MGWRRGASAASAQRGGWGSVASLVLVLGIAIALPLSSASADASYVAGKPDADTGLLPWEPVGERVADAELAGDAVKAWVDLSADGAQPQGSVYGLMADDWGTRTGVYLQGENSDGAPMVALLVTRDDVSVRWSLVATAAISDAASVQSLVVPPGTEPWGLTDSVVAGGESPAFLLLAPQWRDRVAADEPIGWGASGPSNPPSYDRLWEPLIPTGLGAWKTYLEPTQQARPVERLALGEAGQPRTLVEVEQGADAALLARSTGVVFRGAGTSGLTTIDPALEMARRLDWQGQLTSRPSRKRSAVFTGRRPMAPSTRR